MAVLLAGVARRGPLSIPLLHLNLVGIRTRICSNRVSQRAKWGRRLALVTTFGNRTVQLETFIKASAWSLNDASSFRGTRTRIREARHHHPVEEDMEREDDVTDEDW